MLTVTRHIAGAAARVTLQQLEQEVKLDIGTDWSLPDLSGVLPGVRAHPMPDLALETTYFDTADLRLARRHVAVRFRRETEAVPRSRRGGNGPARLPRQPARLHRRAAGSALGRLIGSR